MDFRYISKKYKKIEYGVFIITYVLAVLIIANGMKAIGLLLALCGTIIAIVMNMLLFEIIYTVQEKGLQISVKGQKAILSWNDIKFVAENYMGLRIVTNKDNLEFVILKHVESYKKLKELIKEKSLEYNFMFLKKQRRNNK